MNSPFPPIMQARDNGCAACRRGDTTTALVFVGEPEWIKRGLAHVGITGDQARAVAEGAPESVRGRRMSIAVRLCRECAEKAGMPVGDIHAGLQGGPMPTISQPDDGGA
jgi:hypothetical protein